MNLIKLILYLTEQVLLIIYNDKGSISSHIVYSFEFNIQSIHQSNQSGILLISSSTKCSQTKRGD